MSNGTKPAPLSGAAVVAALIVLAVWLAMVSWLVLHVDASSDQWARLVAVLGSVEAVAFAAAGALFGTTIQKRRVSDARDAAAKAEQRATTAEGAAAKHEAKGKALATAVLTHARAGASAAPVERGVFRGGGGGAGDDTLVALAEDLLQG